MIGCGCNIKPTAAALTGLGVYRGAITEVPIGGVSVIAIYGGVVGGKITNPLLTVDQGTKALTTAPVTETRVAGPYDTYAFGASAYNDDVFSDIIVTIPVYAAAEPLFVSLAGPADLKEGPTTRLLLPGDSFILPLGCATNVWVNAATSGHMFTAIVVQPRTQPPTPYTGSFPPTGPNGKTTTIPSYLYKQYQDDDNLQSLVDAYNLISQSYVDWFNNLYLPIYPRLNSGLLDWVGAGLYDIVRPTLYSGLINAIGPINTTPFNTIAFNEYDVINNVTDVAVTNDDVYKRIITWHFYKGDGKHVTATWLKRRLLRFLYGVNGLDYEGLASQISVIFAHGNLSVTIVTGTRKVVSGAIDTRPFDDGAINGTETLLLTTVAPPSLAPILQEALLTGALETPVQYNVTCRIGILGVN